MSVRVRLHNVHPIASGDAVIGLAGCVCTSVSIESFGASPAAAVPHASLRLSDPTLSHHLTSMLLHAALWMLYAVTALRTKLRAEPQLATLQRLGLRTIPVLSRVSSREAFVGHTYGCASEAGVLLPELPSLATLLATATGLAQDDIGVDTRLDRAQFRARVQTAADVNAVLLARMESNSRGQLVAADGTASCDVVLLGEWQRLLGRFVMLRDFCVVAETMRSANERGGRTRTYIVANADNSDVLIVPKPAAGASETRSAACC